MPAPVAPAAAPPAPAAAPMGTPAPAAPAGGTPPTPAAAPEGDNGATEAFEKQFDLEPSTPPAAPAAQAKPPTPPAQRQAPAKPAAKPAAAPAKPAGQPPEEFEEIEGIKVPKFKKDGEFRSWGLNGYKRAKELEREHTALQAKYTELEKRHPVNVADQQKLTEQLTTIQKRMDEKEQLIQYLNYEHSDEYKQKYEAPYHEAIQRARADIKELTVVEPDTTQPPGENGKHPLKERQATQADFDRVYSLPLGAATKLANDLFGSAATVVLQHRRDIRTTAEKAVKALDDWKKTSEQRAEETRTKSAQERDFIATTWKKVNDDIASKYPDLFAPDPEDKDGNAELEKGFRMADDFFDNDARKSRSIQENMIFDAQARNRIAGFPRLVSRNRKLKADLEQALKDLAELRGSGPGAPEGGSETPPVGTDDSPMDQFEKRF